MKKETIKEIGTINIERLEVIEGSLEMRIPVEVISEQMNSTLDLLFEDFKKNHPSVETICYETRLVFCFGQFNPEFSLTVIIFDGNDQDNVEIWDELEIALPEEPKKQIRKIAWDKLGETFLNM